MIDKQQETLMQKLKTNLKIIISAAVITGFSSSAVATEIQTNPESDYQAYENSWVSNKQSRAK